MWDDALAGFGVAAFPTGKKVYVAQFRKDGRSRRIAIGDHGRLTPDEARSQAKMVLGSVETGADPIAERKATREVRTFRAVADDFLNLHITPKRKSRTAAEYRRLLDLHLLPAVGSKRILDVRRADLSMLHARMVDTPRAANHCLALASAIWNWASRRDEVTSADNPAKGIERYPEQGRERFLTTEELSRLGIALAEGETIGLTYEIDETKPKAKHAANVENRRVKLDPFAVAAIRLLILTGARLREILDAQWAHIDFERGIIFLPDSKTGRKPVYLSAAAQLILASLPRIEGNPHIIAGAKEGAPRADLKKPWAAVCRAAGLEGVRLHDLRHSFASFGAGASLGLPIIGKLLGHTQPATTARYAHLDLDPLRRAVNTIGATIAAAMHGGNDGKRVAIVKFKKR
ncbi:site-specific integrase [Methylocystis sp. MJC1]|uniref:tyrosine-type recombinase/integrase n=1 Tax=Methylocystis sp. MJC1 TaxID=2654282 RepID=UPI0022650328|nr:site-specific integrase [Methylocystis sp. MJC1]UZX11642.1 site-specific integrase [Methylocystis sp. MJC1]